ncbi:MAG TPA: hypothetical protein VGK10_18255 [Prolixibacteraceae bacterium]|jgi:hypothetical protein
MKLKPRLYYTALDLVDKVIELSTMSPYSDDWSFEKQKDNAPRLVRLQQIQALMHAFVPELLEKEELGEAIECFTRGQFIEHRPEKQYDTLLAEMHRTIAESRYPTGKPREIGLRHMEYSYYHLLDYYSRLKKLLNYNKGVMEISYPFYFHFIVTDGASDSIAAPTDAIARLLTMFIDPQGKSFTREELIERYDYPEDDLLDLDLDWM